MCFNNCLSISPQNIKLIKLKLRTQSQIYRILNMEYLHFFRILSFWFITLTRLISETMKPIEKIQTDSEPVNCFLNFTCLLYVSIFNNTNFSHRLTFISLTAAAMLRPAEKNDHICDITYNFNPSYLCWKLSYRNNLNRFRTSKLFSKFHSLNEWVYF